MGSSRNLLLVCGAALLCVVPSRNALHAQGTITGKIIAEGSGQPVAGAHVLVLGTTGSAVAGEDGKYTLQNVRAGNADVQVLNVGYKSQKKAVTVNNGSITEANFVLAVAVTQLADVVISSTGQQVRRVELGNSISTLGDVGKKVETNPINDITGLMVARTPGVLVLPSPVLGGAPIIRIRGISSIALSNAPIWVVDGVRYNVSTSSSAGDTPTSLLNSINPEEIEDIEIVKGPSAATLYGTNAANGVIVVTTKKGRAGKARWNFTGETRTIDDRNTYPMQDANWGHSPSAPTLNKRCQISLMNTKTYTSTLPAASQCLSDSLTSYNPLADPTNTIIHLGRGSLYGMNVSGGTEAVRYFASADLDNEFGPIQMPANDIDFYNNVLHVPVTNQMLHPRAQQKVSVRSNLSAAVNPKLDINVNAAFGKSTNIIEPDNDLLIGLIYTGEAGYGYKGCPATPTASGVPIPANSGNSCGLDKPFADPTGFPQHDYNSFAPGSIMQYVTPVDVQRLTANTDANWRPFSWMQNDATVGIDLSLQDVFHVCRLNECPNSGALSRLGNVSDNRINRRNFSAKMSSTGTWQVNPWANLKTSVGTDYTNEENEQLFAAGHGLPPGASSLAATAVFDRYGTTAPTAVKTLGYYIQEQASLHDRLFLTLAARQDQNSAFGSNFQKVLYPKASVSWIASDEDFFPKFSWLDNLRLRSAYGANGVQPGATAGLQTFSATTASITKANLTTGTDQAGLAANNPGNANLKPETSAEFEAGFEMDMLNRRLHFDYTFYNKKTHDALINVPIPASAGASVTQLLQNVGSTQNWGHEVQLNAQLVTSRMVSWDVTVGASHNSNKWLDLGIDPATCKLGAGGVVDPSTCQERIIGAGGTTQQRVGYPLNTQWYKPYHYADANGDGILQACNRVSACLSEVIVDSARVSTGYNVARDLFSIQNGFDLFDHKLRINAMFDYKGGGNTQDGTNNFDCRANVPLSCPESQDPNSPLWKQARAVASTYGSVVGDTNPITKAVTNTVIEKTQVGYYMSLAAWKFRELSAVYQLPTRAVTFMRAQTGSSVVFGVRNIHTWTKFTGPDPEANAGTTNEGQFEFNTAPLPTYFTLRLNLKY
jgi:TonB-linked SusC/RagA family outer membrane protein